MANIKLPVGVKETRLQAVVIRCRCGNAAKVHPQAVCPIGERVNYGTIAYQHKNPLRTAWFNVRRKIFEIRHRDLYR